MDPLKFVGYLKIFGRLTLTWPPEPKISRREFFLNNLICFIVTSFNFLSIVSLSIKVAKTKDDPGGVSHLIAIIIIVFGCSFQIILVRFQWPRLQMLIQELMAFLKTAKLQEKIVLRRYIERYLGYQFILAATFIAAITNFLSGSIILGKRFPVDAWYPFSTDPLGNRIFVYVFQFMMALETLCLVSGDFMIMLLLWYATARFKLLGTQLFKTRTAGQLRKCVDTHVLLLRFVRETENAVNLIILLNFCTVAAVFLSSGLLLTHHRDSTDLSQFFLIASAAIIRLFGCSWAADDLTEMAGSLTWAIYHAPESGRPLDLSSSISIVIHRSHTCVGISVWGLKVKISRKFFTQYSLKVLSFFMTLRAIVDRYV